MKGFTVSLRTRWQNFDSAQSWDSVQHLNLILAIEETFDVSLETDEVTEMAEFIKGSKNIAETGKPVYA